MCHDSVTLLRLPDHFSHWRKWGRREREVYKEVGKVGRWSSGWGERGREGGMEVGREGRGKKVWQSVGEPPS